VATELVVFIVFSSSGLLQSFHVILQPCMRSDMTEVCDIITENYDACIDDTSI